ncbi:hypothetical protein GMJAKD_04055 [Candidatus Electrothrix aarhusensis]
MFFWEVGRCGNLHFFVCVLGRLCRKKGVPVLGIRELFQFVFGLKIWDIPLAFDKKIHELVKQKGWIWKTGSYSEYVPGGRTGFNIMSHYATNSLRLICETKPRLNLINCYPFLAYLSSSPFDSAGLIIFVSTWLRRSSLFKYLSTGRILA